MVYRTPEDMHDARYRTALGRAIAIGLNNGPYGPFEIIAKELLSLHRESYPWDEGLNRLIYTAEDAGYDVLNDTEGAFIDAICYFVYGLVEP